MFGTNPIRKQNIGDGTTLRIQEIFKTVQGEGPHAGRPAYFVRLAGCNLRCHFCFGWRSNNGRQPYLTMADGPKKKLGDAKVGDWVMTLDGDGQLVKTQIIRIEKQYVDDWVAVTIDGTQYYVTPEHPFFTNRGLIAADDIQVGDEILHAKASDIISWKKLGDRNPMRRPEVSALSAANKDYKKMGLKVAATIKRKKAEGKYTAPFNLLDESEKEDVRLRLSQSRMGEQNPNWRGGPIHPNFSRESDLLSGRLLPCDRCVEITKLEIHHKDRNHDNDCDSNFERLCHRCHSKEHRRGDNFWKSPRKDGKEKLAATNGLLVTKVKRIHRNDLPPSVRPEPLPVTSISCYPHRTYLADGFWNHNCDTDFESRYDNQLTLSQIMEQLNSLSQDSSISLVVITGGEPLLQNIVPLIKLLRKSAFDVQVETAGTVWLPELEQIMYVLSPDFLVCSPKTGKVHERVAALCSHWKYIVSDTNISPADGLPEESTQDKNLKQILYRPNRDNFHTIWLQPMDAGDDVEKTARNTAAAVASCMKYGYRLSVQVHKMVFLP